MECLTNLQTQKLCDCNTPTRCIKQDKYPELPEIRSAVKSNQHLPYIQQTLIITLRV